VRLLRFRENTDALLLVDNDDCDELPLDDLPDELDRDYVEAEIVGLCRALVEVRSVNSDSPVSEAI
jgi:hypothetical protein